MTRKFTLVLLSAIIILSGLTGCGKPPERLDRQGTDSLPQVTTTTLPPETEEAAFSVSSPRFRSGSYQMTSSATQEERYSYQGSAVYAYSMMKTYSYDLGITVHDDGSLTAVYTYTRATVTERTGDSPDVYSVDTNDLSARNDENAGFYDLVGKSFSVSVDPSVNITGLTIEEALAALVDKETLTSMAYDLFYPMPDVLSNGSSFTLAQSGGSNLYTAERLQSGMIVMSIKGGEYPLPDPVQSEDGSSVLTYTSLPPISGSLWMSADDRAVQQLSVTSDAEGKYTVTTDEYGTLEYDYEQMSYSTCTVTPVE